MIVDTSAILAIYYAEEEADAFRALIGEVAHASMSVVSRLESFLVVEGRNGASAGVLLEVLYAQLPLDFVPVTLAQVAIARPAAQAYGKGHHPAALNLGDLFSYALAMETGRPLLFKGNDFSRTDVRRALPG